MSLTLLCLHKNGFFHGGIKPSNILVSKNNKQELTDYLKNYVKRKMLRPLLSTNFKLLCFFILKYLIYYLKL